MDLNGVILPVITPFINDKFDAESYKQLLKHYSKKPFSAIIPCATTGEASVLSDYEFDQIIDITVSYTQLPVFAGVGGNNTKKVLNRLKTLDRSGIKGILSVCPYYNRPSQEGMYEHFVRISESTDQDIIIYNIPYRTGVNMSNDTLLKLAELKNIKGVKDSSGNISQSLELIRNKPANFSVLTGEDILFFTNIVHGGEGGILASSHIYADELLDIFALIKKNNQIDALKIWNSIAEMIPLLFTEPNPAPLKFILTKMGLINSDEVRLPLVQISSELKEKIKKTGKK